MKKSVLWIIAFIAFIAFIVLAIVLIAKNTDKDSDLLYDTREDAIRACVDAAISGIPVSDRGKDAMYDPLFSFGKKNSSYHVMVACFEEKGDLAYSENVYVIEIINENNKYTYQHSTAMMSIYQENEQGEAVTPENLIARLYNREEGYHLLTGKTMQHTVAPVSENLVASNLQDGIAENTFGIFVLQYDWNKSEPEIPMIY